jgi:hypothetical protein
MAHFAKALMLVAILAAPLFASGCVYYPAHPYHGAVMGTGSLGRLSRRCLGWRSLALIGNARAI